MKKKFVIVSIAAALILSAVGAVFIRNFVGKHFWDFIAAELTAEEAARKNAKFPGYGRDTIAILGEGRFQLGKFADDRCLVLCHENDSLLDTLLKGVTAHKIRGGKMYVVSSEGYAVADSGTDTCRLLLTTHSKCKITKDEHIEYLSSIDDFSKDERKILEKLQNKRQYTQ